MINQWTHPGFRAVMKKPKIDKAYRFAEIAMYIQRRKEDGSPSKYARISWHRLRCDVNKCGTWWSCGSSTTFTTHLRNAHVEDAKHFDDDLKAIFCAAVGLDPKNLDDDPDHIQELYELKELMGKFTDNYGSEFGWKATPKTFKGLPDKAQELLNKAAISLMVGLNSNPTAITKRIVSSFIDVCTIFTLFMLPFCSIITNIYQTGSIYLHIIYFIIIHNL